MNRRTINCSIQKNQKKILIFKLKSFSKYIKIAHKKGHKKDQIHISDTRFVNLLDNRRMFLKNYNKKED